MTASYPPLGADLAEREVPLTFEGETAQCMTLAALFEANDSLDAEERGDIIVTLRLGAPYYGGGGAAAAYRIDLAASS